MLYTGTYADMGSCALKPYYGDYDTGDSKVLHHLFANVPILPGRHTYVAKHMVKELDVLSEEWATGVAVGITLVLDILIELGILVAKETARAAAYAEIDARQDLSPEEKEAAKRVVDTAIDGIGKVADKLSENLLGVLAELLAGWLEPERFPLMTSECTINWVGGAFPPEIQSARVIGSGTINTTGSTFFRIATSVPLRRQGGGDYSHMITFGIQYTG